MKRKQILAVTLLVVSLNSFIAAQGHRKRKADPCLDNPHIVTVSPKVLKDRAKHSVDIKLPPNCRCEGRIVIHVLVGEDGTVKCAQYKEGPAQLRKAALEAVRQWKFEPIKLSGVVVKCYGDLELDVSEQTGKKDGV